MSKDCKQKASCKAKKVKKKARNGKKDFGEASQRNKPLIDMSRNGKPTMKRHGKKGKFGTYLVRKV